MDGRPPGHCGIRVTRQNRSGTYKLFRQAIDQTVPEVLAEGRSILQTRVSPDGKEVLYLTGYNADSSAQAGNVMAGRSRAVYLESCCRYRS
jgi:hypothetical protein